jgi:hypothetical protein
LTAAESLDAKAFEKRLESVLAGGDRAFDFAYWMAGQRKSREGRGARPGRGTWQGVSVLSGERRQDLGDETL